MSFFFPDEAAPELPRIALDRIAIERRYRMQAAASDAAWRSGTQAALAAYFHKTDTKHAEFFWNQCHDINNTKELDAFLAEERVVVESKLNEEECSALQQEIAKGYAEKIPQLPYGSGFAQRFLEHIQTKPLNRIEPYLHTLCNWPHYGLPGFFMLNTAGDAAYLRDILVEELEKNQEARRQPIFRAIKWLSEQASKTVSLEGPTSSAIVSPLISEPKLESRQIAMLYYYQGKKIGNDASEIAAKYGLNSNTSGRDLKQFWETHANPEAMSKIRKKVEATRFIKAIEGIISKLDPTQVERAKKDIENIRQNITKSD